MIALDTSVLVHAHRTGSPQHHRAAGALRGLAAAATPWGVPWPCVHEFLAVVTNPRILADPTPLDLALKFLADLSHHPLHAALGETPSHLEVLGRLLRTSGATGPRVHDARIAAICLTHGVRELWTADRDFSWFPGLRTRNPLIEALA